jgi:diguanylate cyclase (GGDEF)-like protein
VGADDYLPKPFSDDELEARIFASLRVKASEMELKKRNVELQSMLQHVEALAVTDALTGLYNRRRFEDVLKREFAVTKRYDTPLSCLMIDVDHFKSINDTHGHDAGDIVLREIAQRLSQRLREVDLAARYGGEEFAILLPQTNKEGAVIVAERIMERIRREEFDFEGTSLCVTVSIGVAGNADIVGKSPESLVKAADAALYQAKEQGRNRVVAFRGDDIPPSSST